MKVTLLAYTPEPEKTVASAAKLCYSPSDIETLQNGLDEQKIVDFVTMLGEIGHESPIEHVSFTFGIEGVSRSLLAQITRHRIASYSVQSQRYVSEAHFEFVTPPAIAENPQAAKLFQEAMEASQSYYDQLTDLLKQQHCRELLEEGVPEKEAQKKAGKMAIEDARFVLPNACDTKMIMTINARSLHNFFRHRCCRRAQWEIRQLAEEMLKLVLEVAPHLFQKAGPPCVFGPCPEGKMSCGKSSQVRRQYAGILNPEAGREEKKI